MPPVSAKRIAVLSAVSLLAAGAGVGGGSMAAPSSPSPAAAPSEISSDASNRQSGIDTTDLAWIALHKIASGTAPDSEQAVDAIIDSPPCVQGDAYAAQLNNTSNDFKPNQEKRSHSALYPVSKTVR